VYTLNLINNFGVVDLSIPFGSDLDECQESMKRMARGFKEQLDLGYTGNLYFQITESIAGVVFEFPVEEYIDIHCND